WTLSDPFFFMHDESKRRVFVESVREFMETWKFFDGVDIDYEFPGGKGANPDLGDPDIDGDTYVVLMKELREMLDELGEKNDRYYELTSAINVGYDKLAVVDYGEASKYLDHIYMMSYDFYGAWDQQNFNHQTGLHASSVNPGNEYYASKGVDILLAQGVPANKLIVGAAAYGRGWKGIKDISGDNPFTGTASGPIKGTWEDGVLDYRDIANNHGEAQGFKSFYDAQAEAAYRFNSTTGELISYDNERSVKAKARYALEQGLAGIFHWEVDGDNGELTNAMHEGLGHGNNTEDDDQPVNLPPIARAGQDLTVQGPITVRLNGENSTDPEGGELDYSWKQVSGELLNVRGESSDSVTVEVPAVTQDETYVFELTVVDEHGLSDSDTIEIKNSVVKENNPPIIDLPSIFYVSEGQQLNVAVNAKDPDGDLMDYHWSISPELKIITGEYTKTVTLLAPLVDSDTQYDISVSVSDGEFTVRAESTIQVSDKVVDELPPADTCTDEDSSADNYPAWDASTIYTNELVSHKGLVFKAKWWVKNSEPLVGNEAWELISELELPWSGLVAYSGGDEVNHDGNRWKAKWWTKNNEPGQDSVWVNIGLATCN
ncbi:glycosyl hydrolase family 18 protein, partial [Vibrio coralliirubri]|uniref:glycosyl hydrolase family 18 protein n=1 Tax=Vibrio coralliirubri TaxID=1516159 RepID=UPI002FCFD8B1